MIKEQKSKQNIRLKRILNLTFSSIATQQKCYDSVDLLLNMLRNWLHTLQVFTH